MAVDRKKSKSRKPKPFKKPGFDTPCAGVCSDTAVWTDFIFLDKNECKLFSKWLMECVKYWETHDVVKK